MINKEIIDSINKKNKLFNKYLKCKNIDRKSVLFTEYKLQKNRLLQSTRQSKKSFFSELCQ